jgi:DNA-binding NarL/FixJ family response regulator
MPFEVVLVDDHKLVRDGVRTILERGSEFQVVGEAETGADAVHLCRKSQPDIVLMDIGLPGMNGIETTNELLRHCPGIKVIILSMFDDENSVVSAIRSGARAFVLKKASSTELLDALRAVARGGSYLSSQVSDRLLMRIQRGDLATKERSSAISTPTTAARSNPFRRASCRCCAWWPKARPARISRCCSISACRPCAATARR